VRVTGDIGGCTEMYGADAMDSGLVAVHIMQCVKRNVFSVKANAG
jgi:hypothetical protein